MHWRLRPGGSRDVVFNLKHGGEKLTGTTSSRGGDLAFSAVCNFNGQEFKINYNGKLEGDNLKLKFTMMDMDRELALKKE